MKSLIVEDEFSSRLILQKYLGEFGEVHLAVNGREAAEAVHLALKQGAPYDLITLDIMMPEITGTEALQSIRDLEGFFGLTHAKAAKVLMTTALNDAKSIMRSFKDQCDGYLVKPFTREELCKHLEKFALVTA